MVDIVYRNPGPWGAGKGSRLTSMEGDTNLYGLETAVEQLQVDVDTLGPASTIEFFSVSGDQFYVHMGDYSVLGPYQLPAIAWNFREDGIPPGSWLPSTFYAEFDVFTHNGSVYQVLLNHTSDTVFDPGASSGPGQEHYQLLLTNPANAIPQGGTTGQVLTKFSDDDYAISWFSAGIPQGGTAGQILLKDSYEDFNLSWHDIADLFLFGLPEYIGKQTIWVPATAMLPQTTNGAESSVLEMSSNKNMVVTMNFDSSTEQFAQFTVAMPKGWDKGPLQYVPYWSHGVASYAFGVVWQLDAVAIANSEDLDATFAVGPTVADEGGTDDELYQGDESSDVVVGGTINDGAYVQFRVHRTPANASDTLAADARLHGIALIYTTEAAVDD